MMRHTGDGFLGLELTSNEWLQNHFLAKSPERMKQIAALPIRAGDTVLDVCCGPGHYAELFALMVGPAGHVFAVDKDPTHIDVAERRKPLSIVRDLISYDCFDVSTANLPPVVAGRQLDVVTIFNSLFYFDDQVEILNAYLTAMKPGGRLIIKDSDFGFFLVSPFETGLQQRVIAAAERDDSRSFNNFAGRRLFHLASKLKNVRREVIVWPYAAYSPMSEAMKRYVSVNLLTLADQAKPFLTGPDFQTWSQLYDVAQKGAHINSNEFLFVMNEHLVIITKLPN